MTSIKQTILSNVQQSISVPMMDVNNISNIIVDYVNEERLTYWKGEHRGFYNIAIGSKNIGFIPDNDEELLNRIKELVNYTGWDNSNRQVRLDISSWRNKGKAIRTKIFDVP